MFSSCRDFMCICLALLVFIVCSFLGINVATNSTHRLLQMLEEIDPFWHSASAMNFRFLWIVHWYVCLSSCVRSTTYHRRMASVYRRMHNFIQSIIRSGYFDDFSASSRRLSNGFVHILRTAFPVDIIAFRASAIQPDLTRMCPWSIGLS